MKVTCKVCGKKFTGQNYLDLHRGYAHPAVASGEFKAKGWATPYGFVDFADPVTYAEACEMGRKLAESLQANGVGNGK